MSYVRLNTPEAVARAVKHINESRVVAIDFETQGLDPYTNEILLMAVKAEQGPVFIGYWHEDDGLFELLHTLEPKILVAHNAAFEYMFLKNKWHWTEHREWFCTALAEKVLTNGIISADASYAGVVKKYIGRQLSKELQTSWIDMSVKDFNPTPEQLEYATLDVLYLHEIMEAQLSAARHEGLLRTLRLEMKCLPAFGEMRLKGFFLDLDKHARVLAEYQTAEMNARFEAEQALNPLWQQHIAKVNEERAVKYANVQKALDAALQVNGIKRLTKDTPADVRELVTWTRKERDKFKPKKVEKINLGSSDQVLAALAVAGIHPVATEWNGEEKASLDKNVLREWQHEPLIQMYTAWSKPNKVVTTYGENLRKMVNPVTGRIHSDYNQIVSSGRCSSRGPNQQNEPPAIRKCFRAEDGNVLIVADAKNQEGRLAAILSGDKNLLAVFERGEDWHQRTAALAYPDKFANWQDVPKDSPERAGSKNANFSSIYGGTSHTLYQRGYVPSLEVGEILMNAVYEFAPQLRAWSLSVADKAVSEGYAETIIGRKRYFRLPPKPRYNPDNQELYQMWRRARGGVRRAAMNHPVQGSGADVMKQAMVMLLDPMAAIGYHQVTFVHDELVYEGPEQNAEEAARLVGHYMEQAAACFTKLLPIPADVHITKEWTK